VYYKDKESKRIINKAEIRIMKPNGPAIWGGSRYAGQVVLPDASTGQSPCSLGRKLSRCKESMLCPDEQSETGARVFAVMVQSLDEHYECRDTKQVKSRFFVTMQDANFGH
jgi:hypothetical protein